MHFDFNYDGSRLDQKFNKPYKDVSKTGCTGTVPMSCVEPGIQRSGGDHYIFTKMKMVEMYCEALSESPAEDQIRIYMFMSKLV